MYGRQSRCEGGFFGAIFLERDSLTHLTLPQHWLGTVLENPGQRTTRVSSCCMLLTVRMLVITGLSWIVDGSADACGCLFGIVKGSEFLGHLASPGLSNFNAIQHDLICFACPIHTSWRISRLPSSRCIARDHPHGYVYQ